MPSSRFWGQRRGPPPLGSSAPEIDGDGDGGSQLPPASQLPPPTQLDQPADCVNRNPTPKFSLVVDLMDRLRSEKATARVRLLERFIELWRAKVGNDLYPLIRILLPDRDRERPVYNLKEAMLAKCYIEVLGLDKHSEAAQRLIKWKQPVDGQVETGAGDFARVCYHEIAARSTVEQSDLSVADVNDLLDQLARGRLKQNEYVPILRRINEQCTPVQQEWIIRIILKDLRISMREKGVLGCLHPEAGTLFNVCSDLKRVCWTLYKPEIHLEQNQANIELFRCFLPQLCYRSPTSSHEAIAKLVGAPSADFIMEEKLDGERIQLHMRGNGAEWFYCSRKAKDYTYLYGSHIGEGSLTPYISNAFQDGVRNVILDGEMMVWDPALEKYLAFGTLKTAAGDKVLDENSPRPCFKVFDILYLNDKCLTQTRLSERKKLLRSGRIFRDMDDFRGRIEFVEESIGKSGKDIRNMLEKVLESKGEGLVVKKADSYYDTNSRGADWVKVKPEYADQMGENLDLLVLGGWWGKGGRTGKISSLLLGLRVPQEDDGSSKIPQFTTFASVGSGMSYADYEWILTKHKQDWKPFDRSNPPRWMNLGLTGIDDKPDVYIEPEKSFVVDIKASEIVPAAGGYGAGYTLRFPRCRFIHWDRASREHPGGDEHRDRDLWNCLSVDEFKALLHQPSKRYRDDEGGTTTRKKRKTEPKRKKVLLFESFRGQTIADDAVEDNIFGDVTFYIPKDAPGYTKSELESLIRKHGGDFTQAQLADLSAVVISCDDKTPRVKAQIRKGVSVVKPQWILESIKRRRRLPFLKEFLVFASEQATDDRYYRKTLEEFDEISLVRDRTGDGVRRDEDVNESNDDVPPGTATLVEGPLKDVSPGSQFEESSDEEESDNEYTRRLRASQYDIDSEEDEDEAEEEEEEEEEEGPPAEARTGVAGAEKKQLSPRDTSDSEGQRLLPLLEHGQGETLTHKPMGEDLNATAYDDDKIFHHLVFYIDSAANAAQNGLALSSPSPASDARLEEAKRMLLENGGTVVEDVDDPRLTHIIMDDDDSARYVELVRRTAKPKHKHIVLPTWVSESFDEETLMNEDAHKPQ